VGPLLNRLESLFMGRSLVRNILSQAETTIDFRKAIENKEIITEGRKFGSRVTVAHQYRQQSVSR
jgi:hypothetical protein